MTEASFARYSEINREYFTRLLINFGEKSLRAERYLYQPDEDDFVLLTQKNYKDYISNL